MSSLDENPCRFSLPPSLPPSPVRPNLIRAFSSCRKAGNAPVTPTDGAAVADVPIGPPLLTSPAADELSSAWLRRGVAGMARWIQPTSRARNEISIGRNRHYCCIVDLKNGTAGHYKRDQKRVGSLIYHPAAATAAAAGNLIELRRRWCVRVCPPVSAVIN